MRSEAAVAHTQLCARMAQQARAEGWRIPANQIARVLFAGTANSGHYTVWVGSTYSDPLFGSFPATPGFEKLLYAAYLRVLVEAGVARD